MSSNQLASSRMALTELRISGRASSHVLLSDYSFSIEDYDRLTRLEWMGNELQKLTLSSFSAEFFRFLPPNLIELHIEYLQSGSNLDEAMLELPNSLKILLIDSNPMLTDEALPALPHDLMVLSLRYNEGIRGGKYPFPRRLMALHLGSGLNSRSAHHLPRFLTDLELNNRSIGHDALTGLPNTLTRLMVHAKNSNLRASFVFPRLPRSLLILDISLQILEDDDVAELPRGMIEFSSRSSGELLSDASASLWPPRLQVLRIRDSNYTFNGLTELPKTLTVVMMERARFALPPPPGQTTATLFSSRLLYATIGQFGLPPHF